MLTMFGMPSIATNFDSKKDEIVFRTKRSFHHVTFESICDKYLTEMGTMKREGNDLLYW